MNAVSLLINSNAQVTGSAARSEGTREDQAAFSPALMLLIAAGLAPTPLPQQLPVVPDTDTAANAFGTELPSPGADTDLGSDAESQLTTTSHTQHNSPAVPQWASGALALANFKPVAPRDLPTAAPQRFTLPAAIPTPALDTPAGSAPAAIAPAPDVAAATPTPAVDATLLKVAPTTSDTTQRLASTVHVESRDFASRNFRRADAGVRPAIAVAGMNAEVTPAATATALSATSPPSAEVSAQARAATTSIAAAIVTNQQHATPTVIAGLAKSEPVLESESPAGNAPPVPDTSSSGEAVLDTARRAAAVANHPTQRLKRSGATAKQAAPAGPEPTVAATGTKPSPGRQEAPNGEAPVALAPAPLPGVTPVPQEVKPAIVSNEGFAARSTQRVPEDPRLDSADGPRNLLSRPDQVTLRVEGEGGEEARLRIAVRGRDVRATIVTDDPSLARRLEDGLGSLRNALGDRGFERSQLLVQGAAIRSGDAPQEHPRDPSAKQRQQNPDSNPKQGKQSETPEQRSRSRSDRNEQER